MLLTEIVVLCLLQFAVVAQCSFCPYGCACADTLVVCTCDLLDFQQPSSTNSSMTSLNDEKSVPYHSQYVLPSFRGIDYVSKIFIHSCDRLTINTDTFQGLTVGYEMTIMNIGQLTIEPHAFRQMRKYPDHFTIKDAHVQIIKKNAFSGFTKSIHFWMRNLTVDLIESGAFNHVSKIDYVYIYDSYIKKLEQESFGKMTSINNFFFRGNVKLNRVENFIFKLSSISSIVFEDTAAISVDLYAFSGLTSFDHMQIHSCTFNFRGAKKENSLQTKTESAKKLEFYKVALNNFPLGAIISNVVNVRIEQSQVKFANFHMTSGRLENSTTVHFLRTHIENIPRGVFSHIKRVKDLVFENCTISSVEMHAFEQAYIENARFTNSKINTVAKKAFGPQFNCRHLIFDSCHIETVASSAFFNSQFDFIRFRKSKIHLLNQEALAHTFIKRILIIDCNIEKISRSIFDKVQYDLINITGNTIHHLADDVFSGISAANKIIVQENKFKCTCSDLFTDLAISAAILSKTDKKLAISQNFCIEDKLVSSTLNLRLFMNRQCLQQRRVKIRSFNVNEQFYCQKFFAWTLCTCLAADLIFSSFTLQEIYRQTSVFGSISGLTISSCDRIKFTYGSLATLSLVATHFIIENSTLEFNAGLFNDQTRTSLRMEYSTENFDTTDTKMRSFILKDCSVYNISPKSFSYSNVEFFVFKNSFIRIFKRLSFEYANILLFEISNSSLGEFEAGFAKSSNIKNFTISNSRIGRVMKSAFEFVNMDSLNIIYSTIGIIEWDALDSRKFMTDSFLCFTLNFVKCECDSGGLRQILKLNGCYSYENFCIGSNAGNKRITDSVDLYNSDLFSTTQSKDSCQWGDYVRLDSLDVLKLQGGQDGIDLFLSPNSSNRFFRSNYFIVGVLLYIFTN